MGHFEEQNQECCSFIAMNINRAYFTLGGGGVALCTYIRHAEKVIYASQLLPVLSKLKLLGEM